MRTTLTIDDDVLAAVKERAQREHRTVGQVLSDLARQALSALPVSRDAGSADEFFGFAPLPHRGKPVSNALIDRLRGEDPE